MMRRQHLSCRRSMHEGLNYDWQNQFFGCMNGHHDRAFTKHAARVPEAVTRPCHACKPTG